MTQVVEHFVAQPVCDHHSDRMDAHKNCPEVDMEDLQAVGAWSWYGLHWDLLEDYCDKMSELTGLDLLPSYDYSRIYSTGHVLVPHKDRPSCDVSVTVNLKNVGPKWEFFWTGGSFAMDEGDAVIYRGPLIQHWREENPADFTYQVFLHYVDANGPHADRANEYMDDRHRSSVSYKGN